VASWNVHSGVDGWGRPFDVTEGCRRLDADVLVLEETWAEDGAVPLAKMVGESLHYQLQNVTIARGTIFPPPPLVLRRWGPPLWKRSRHGPRVDLRSPHPGHAATSDGENARPGLSHARPKRGAIGLAVLSRLPVSSNRTFELGQLFGDPTKRYAIASEVLTGASAPGSAPGSPKVVVLGTHLSHLRHGSLSQVARLRKAASQFEGPDVTVVVAGDMNLPGAVMSVSFPGFHRAVKGRTWPAWRPLGQPDQILVQDGVNSSGQVVPIRGSDHLPVRAVVTLG